jgi:hypothetical protein
MIPVAVNRLIQWLTMIRHDIPCVIKAGNKKASWLLPQIEPAVHEYAACRNLAVDHVRHGAMGTRERYKPNEIPDVRDTDATANDYMDATTLGSPEGNAFSKLNPDGTLRTKGCIIGHRLFAPRMEKRTKDIKLGPGPAPSYKSKPAIEALRVFAQKLLPLTQTVEALFHAFLPEEYSKYKAVYGTIYDGRADNIDEAFGIWTSRSLVINANTNNHKDVEDVCHGWCAVVVLGDFKGGDACFPELGVKIDCPPGTIDCSVISSTTCVTNMYYLGSIIFMRSYAVEHYIGSFVGRRYSVVHFTHQVVHDAYVERTGKPLWEFSKMPEWWQKSRGNLNV